MAKGDVKFINCIGSTGSVVIDFNTKQPIPGQYRHTQTVGGKPIAWKCGLLSITGVAKVVEDAYLADDAPAGTAPTVFYRMEGLVDKVETLTNVQAVGEALKTMVW